MSKFILYDPMQLMARGIDPGFKKMNIIQLCAERAGLSTRAYTGRGMYKSKCLGIDCTSFAIFLTKTMRQINGEDELNQYAEAIASYKTDSMGMGMIIYFPSIEYFDSHEDKDEFDDQED